MAENKKSKKTNKKETAKEVEVKEVEKEVVVEETVEAPKKTEITDKEKKKMIKEEKKNSQERSPFQRFMNGFLWIVVIAWMAISVYDYYQININKKDNYKPLITLATKNVEFSEDEDNPDQKDAAATEYYTLGFKVVRYTKGSCNGGIEFKAFFFKPRTNCR